MFPGSFSMLLLIVLLIFGVSAGVALGLAAVGYFAVTRGVLEIPHEIIAQRLVAGVDSFTLLAIPLFIFVGHMMNASGATTRLFSFANALVGHVRGGLAQVNIIASMLFAGMSGSGVADAAGLGAMEVRAMRDAGYDDKTTIGVTVGSSLIGPIIPPSIPAILYAVLAGVSATDMLLAGIVPGLLMALAMMALAACFARRRGLPSQAFPGMGALWASFLAALAPLLTPIILLSGIFAGVFTATEAAAVAGLWALLVGTVFFRNLGLRGLAEVFRKSAYDTAVIFFILAASALFAWVLTRARVPDTMANWLSGLTSEPAILMALVIIFLLFIGCFMAVSVAINILTPILVPIVIAFGIDPVHFGIVMIMLLVIGEATPPFGMVLFAMTKVADTSYERVAFAALPWLAAILAVVLLVAAVPGLALWLPGLLG
ncbi:TRAP-type C4-dicarboxylate transport system, large permease component [Salipiger mucosus DSM 16094]|uniref:TRAP transporter large permease protein n=2 Tax=Salipiger mucosus TaxID=263378 RepID=S9RS51_9RHOB|nr:TRAP-type C4-dicarboxylate transport system, large permease component [Salipiger mucosus DSM 16094]